MLPDAAMDACLLFYLASCDECMIIDSVSVGSKHLGRARATS